MKKKVVYIVRYKDKNILKYTIRCKLYFINQFYKIELSLKFIF